MRPPAAAAPARKYEATAGKAAPATAPKPVSLALQGGGAHGAFTWGVLDHFLEDGRLDIRAISATSAGAMNAVVLAEGLLDGGPPAARRQLERFWRSVSVDGKYHAPERALLHPILSFWGAGHFAGNAVMEALSHAASPYTLNPLNLNPLRDFLDKEIRFDVVRSSSPRQPRIANQRRTSRAAKGRSRSSSRCRASARRA